LIIRAGYTLLKCSRPFLLFVRYLEVGLFKKVIVGDDGV
jgi:hypothetical protein